MTAFALHANLGLSRNPFPPTPDAGSYFFTPHLQEQFSEVMHCIEARKGFVLLTGEVGLGKSTLVRRLLDALPADTTRSALVFNTFLQSEALLNAILRDFGLAPADSLDEGLSRLNQFLIDQHRTGTTCLLVIDDAQNLKVESLELVRLLCNLETGQEKLLQILLSGQPELEAILDTRELRQLKSRIVKHTRLSGLQRDETRRYFEFRVNAAGSSGRIQLHPQAARLLHAATGGNLRRIHLVLDRCLYGLAALGKTSINPDLMKAALRDVAMSPPAPERTSRLWPALAALCALTTVGASAAAWHFWQAGAAGAVPAAPLAAAAAAPALDTSAPREPTPAEPAPPVTSAAPAPVPAAPPAPRPVAATPTDTGRLSEEQCLQTLGKPAAHQSLLRSALPPALLPRLPGRQGLCLFQREQQPWALWLSQARGPMSAVAASPAAQELQRALVRQGQLSEQDVDGLYGPRTASALAQFQSVAGLPITPAPDELTLMLLEKLDAPSTPPRAP